MPFPLVPLVPLCETLAVRLLDATAEDAQLARSLPPWSSRAMAGRLEEFRTFRERMNARILEAGNLEIKRFFALDSRCYEPGALDVKTKELLGLVASLVLRCDDCITYHVVRCKEEGVTDAQFFEAF